MDAHHLRGLALAQTLLLDQTHQSTRAPLAVLDPESRSRNAVTTG